MARPFYIQVGMRGFEPPLSRPPDVRFNRTKLHPVFFGWANIRFPLTFLYLKALKPLPSSISYTFKALVKKHNQYAHF